MSDMDVINNLPWRTVLDLPLDPEKRQGILEAWDSANTSLVKCSRGREEYRTKTNEGKLHRLSGPAVIERNVFEAWYRNGVKDRSDGPAVITYRTDGKVLAKEWFKDGKEHSYNDNPSIIFYVSNSIWGEAETARYYHKEGKNHRDDNKPSALKYEGKVLDKPSTIIYQVDGKYHRTDGPAYWTTYHDGTPMVEAWYINDILQRADGPARIKYHRHGATKEEVWCQKDGKCSREDGPAITKWWPSGIIKRKEWWANHEMVKRKDYDKQGDRVNVPTRISLGNGKVACITIQDE